MSQWQLMPMPMRASHLLSPLCCRSREESCEACRSNALRPAPNGKSTPPTRLHRSPLASNATGDQTNWQLALLLNASSAVSRVNGHQSSRHRSADPASDVMYHLPSPRKQAGSQTGKAEAEGWHVKAQASRSVSQPPPHPTSPMEPTLQAA